VNLLAATKCQNCKDDQAVHRNGTDNQHGKKRRINSQDLPIDLENQIVGVAGQHEEPETDVVVG